MVTTRKALRLAPRALGALALVCFLTPAALAARAGEKGAEIRWVEWTDATLLEAAQQKRPVLLYFDAFWCGECRRFEEEVLGDATLRERIATGFLAVRADRDRRPDLFARYSLGGPPSIAFLLPSGNPLYFQDGEELLRAGGTQLSLEALPPYLDLVERHYRRSAAALDRTAEAVRASVLARRQASSVPVTAELADLVANFLLRFQDREHGGVGPAPRPVTGLAVRAALRYFSFTGNPQYLEFARRTLDGMSRGAIRDPLDGSFRRVARSADWGEPAPERLLQTQTDMLQTYLDAYRLLGEARYRQLAGETTDAILELFYVPELKSFRSTLVPAPAGSERWTWGRFRKALQRDQIEAARLRYGMDPGAGDRLQDLQDALDAEEVAGALSRPREEVVTLLDGARQRLRAARAERSTLRADPLILTAWNARAAAVLLQAAVILERPDAMEAADAALEYLEQELVSADEGVFHGMEVDPARVIPVILLADQIQMARAWLQSFQVTGDPARLERARTLLEFVLSHFQDREAGGLVDRVRRHGDMGELLAPLRLLEDNAEAVVALFELAALMPGNPAWKSARSILQTFADEFPEFGLQGISFLPAVLSYLELPARVLVVDTGGDPLAADLRRAAIASGPLWTVVLSAPDQGADEFLRTFGILPGQGTAAYLLREATSHRGPFRTVEELRAGLAPPEEP